ncbi:hypothetical protein Tco_0658521 [Tanacetum coccineum]
MRIEESLNVTFDERFLEPKSSSSVENDRIDEPIVQELNGSPHYKAFIKLCIVEDPIWEKISCELKEPIHSAHVDECECCQVQHMTKESMYALRKEMREIHTLIKNNLKVLTAVVEDIARVFLQDINEE